MKISFSANRPNGSILSPILCDARVKNSIILFVHMPINIGANPCFCIVLHFSQLPPFSKLLYCICFCVTVRMSSKTSKVAKSKHGVKVMGLTKDSSTPSSPVSTTLVEHQETLDVQPLLHAP